MVENWHKRQAALCLASQLSENASDAMMQAWQGIGTLCLELN